MLVVIVIKVNAYAFLAFLPIFDIADILDSPWVLFRTGDEFSMLGSQNYFKDKVTHSRSTHLL